MGSARDRMLEGLPVAERRLRPAGVSTVVLEGGDGPPLVLLHGAIESGGAYWAPVIERLAERHRVVVPDVPGLGESDPVADLTPDAFAEWFRALLRETCEDRPTLVGHSMGGALAARYAVQHGGSLTRLVIYAGPGVGPYRIPVGLAIRAIMFDLRPSERNADRFDRFAFFDLDAARRRDGAWLEAWSLYARERATVPHVKRTMRRLINRGKKQVSEAELRRITVPTSLIWGSHDRFGDFEAAESAYREGSRHGREPHPGLALLRLAQGKTDAAAAAIRRVLDETAAPGVRAGVLPAYVEIMLAAGDEEAAGDACRELAAIAEGQEVVAIEAMAAEARGRVALAGEDHRDALASLRRAAQGWQQLDAPYEAARVRSLVALACRELGDEDTATLELEGARAVFEELEAAPDLARLDELALTAAAGNPYGLTDRELEVLRHLSAGATNKAIAAELVLSVRTVDRHVSNIFTKLGVSSRAAATAHAHEHHVL